MTKDDAEDVAREAAQRIVDAVSTFAPWVRLRLAAALADEPSDTLRSIGGSLLGKAPAATMARSLLADVFIGDLEDIAPTLGDTEPWSTIRSALEDVAAAWHTSHPGLRTRRDYTARSRSWALEAVSGAARRPGWSPSCRHRRRTSPPGSAGDAPCPPRRRSTGSATIAAPRRSREAADARGNRQRQVARGYTGKHAVLRKRWTPRVAAGGVACGRCGLLIQPGTPWDLGHPDDDKRREPTPWHQRCNRVYASTVTKRRRRFERGR